MKSSRTVGAAAAIASALAAGLAVAPSALAAGYTLHLSGPRAAVVSEPFALQATGTDPTDQGALYLEVDAIPASVTATCPSGYLDGSQLAANTGGSLVAFDDPENFDSAGSFSMAVGYTPDAARAMLFCAYTDDGAGDTLATASWVVNVQASGGTQQPRKPVNTKKPVVTRSGSELSCSRGAWRNHPTAYSYRWLIDGRAKTGAHGARLTVTRALRTHKIRCGVTASNKSGATTAISAPYKVH